MFKYTIKRVLQSLGTVLIVVSIVSLLLSLMPTDYYFTEEQLIKLTDKQKEDQLAAAGLLDSPIVQLFHFLENVILKFDLGTSRRIQAGVPVIKVIGDKFAISMRLGCIALVISLILGVPMGILQARHKDHLFDHIGAAYTIFVNAVPRLVSYSLVLVIGVKLFGLPTMYSTRHAARSSILPIICLAMGSTASYALWMRRYMVDELTKDYIKLARIKGAFLLHSRHGPAAHRLDYPIRLKHGSRTGAALCPAWHIRPVPGRRAYDRMRSENQTYRKGR